MTGTARYVAAFGWIVGGGYLVYLIWHTPRCRTCSPERPR